MAKGENSKYIVTDLTLPEEMQAGAAEYAQWATRILWLDGDVVPDSFQVNCSWYRKPTVTPAKAHTHDYDEVLAFFSSLPDDPHNLGAEAEFWIEDEKYTITNSSFVFVPKGIKHAPLRFNRVDRPVFHFTLGHGKMYF